jgi:hypothetical protein
MVDFHNPAVIEEDFLAVVKLWHVVGGTFMWALAVLCIGLLLSVYPA